MKKFNFSYKICKFFNKKKVISEPKGTERITKKKPTQPKTYMFVIIIKV